HPLRSGLFKTGEITMARLGSFRRMMVICVKESSPVAVPLWRTKRRPVPGLSSSRECSWRRHPESLERTVDRTEQGCVRFDAEPFRKFDVLLPHHSHHLFIRLRLLYEDGPQERQRLPRRRERVVSPTDVHHAGAEPVE